MSEGIYLRAVQESALPHGAKVEVELAGKSILVCNWNEQLYAVSNICTHANEKLHCGKMANGWIACPAHGARFDLATGAAKNPPATRPIATYAVRRIAGWVEILLDASN